MSKKKETEPSQEIKFKVGDRVKVDFRNKWWPGTVVKVGPRPIKTSRFLFDFFSEKFGEEPEIVHKNEESVIYLYPGIPWMYIETDEKVDDRPNALFGGFGIQGPARHGFAIFEDESEPDISKPPLLDWREDDEEFPF